MTPKDRYPLLDLKNRSLYDLIPGKIHVISIDTLEDFATYDSQRELWKALNPSSDELENLSVKQQHNRVGRYLNIERPNGSPTELGYFYFARHPEYLPNLAKKASGFFAVNTKNGMVQYYSNNTQAGNRGTVRRHRENNTVSKGGIRYINQDIFIQFYTEAIAKEGFICQLNLEQIRNLPNNPSKF